jgi:monovalent cation:H+ antiporter, CPA1 family
VPESVAFVLLGILIGQLIPAVRSLISADLVLLVLVPGLIFDAAFDLEWPQVRGLLPALVGLAVPGVVISALIVAVALNLGAGLPLGLAFVVGAITSATDPVAVVATLTRLRMPHGLRTLIEGESLLNDGTGLALVAIAVRAITSDLSTSEAVRLFVLGIGASVVIGYPVGVAGAWLVRASRRSSLGFVLSVIYVYSAYAIATSLSLSGVLVTVVAAMTMGHMLRGSWGDAPLTREVDQAWAVVAFALSALAFLAMGAVIELGQLASSLGATMIGIVAVLAARAAIVYVPYLILARKIPVGWAHVVFWSGLRGAIAFAAVLALPHDLPQRQVLQDISLGIVLFTLVINGTTASLVIRAAIPERGD